MKTQTAVLLFSRDRALQLDATLRSLLLHCADLDRAQVCVLFTTTGEPHARQYEQLRAEYAGFPFLRFVREQDFRADLLSLLSPFDHVLFLVDDNIFVQDFDLAGVVRALEDRPEAVGYSLRLGKNTTYCYSLDAPQPVPPMDVLPEGTCRFRWVEAACDFGYPLEVSSSVYRVRDLFALLAGVPFRNPNTLEAALDQAKGRFAGRMPYLLCRERTVTFCMPLNKVQTVAPANRASEAEGCDPGSFAALFDQGWRVHVASYAGFVPEACHQEVDLDLVDVADVGGAGAPVVSVVIPCYNQAAYLPEAVESVVAQTFDAWELIVVNDGSTDATAQVADALAARYADRAIRVIHQENAGLAGARNAGVQAARGRYILPLDADDLLDPRMLEKTVAVLEAEPNVSIVYTHRADFGAAGGVVQAPAYDFDALCQANRLSYCSLYRRQAWVDAGGYNPNMIWGYEDWDFWIACGDRGHTGRLLPEPLFRYRVRENSMYSAALRYDKELKARVVLNHPHLYSEDTQAWARQVWDAAVQPGPGPTFSVVVPTYDRPEMLEQALHSVLAQTCRDFEVIVVNDAGTSVAAVVAAFEDARLRYVEHERNQGLAAARNTGLRAARGRYVALLDDDDLFYPRHLETALQHLSDETPVLYTDAVRATFERRGDGYQLVEKRVPYSIDFDRTKLLVANIAPVNCFVFSRTLALEAGLFDPSLSVLEDWDFWLRLSERAAFKHVPERTVQVNWRTDGTTMTAARAAAFSACRERIEARHRDALARIPNRAALLNAFRAIWAKDGKVQEPLVSIVILTHNALDYTKQCVAALQRHTHLLHEVIFVDNASTDGTCAYLEALVSGDGRYRLLRNDENVGFAQGNNQALAVARGAYLLLLNNDAVVTEGWLERLVACAEFDPRIGVVGPMTNSTSGPQALAEVGYDVRTLDGLDAFAARRAQQYAGKWMSYWRVVGFCMMIRREVVDRIGGLDPIYGKGNFEDDDYCVRSAVAGFDTVVVGDSFVHHFGGTTFRANEMDHRKALLHNWEVFKQKWAVPEAVAYGQRLAFDMTPILQQPFAPARHVVALPAPAAAAVPAFPVALQQFQEQVAARDWQKAAGIAAAATRAFPRESYAWVMLAISRRMLGRFPEALDATRQSLLLEETPFALFELAQISLAAGSPDEAHAVAHHLLQRFPDWSQRVEALLPGEALQPAGA